MTSNLSDDIAYEVASSKVKVPTVILIYLLSIVSIRGYP